MYEMINKIKYLENKRRNDDIYPFNERRDYKYNRNMGLNERKGNNDINSYDYFILNHLIHKKIVDT